MTHRLHRNAVAIVAVALLGLCAIGCSEDPGAAKHRFLSRGDRYFAEGKFKEALIDYRNAVKTDAASGEARRKLADTYLKLNDLGNGYREYIRAADLLPGDSAVQLQAATMHILAERFADAQTLADKVLSREPRNVHAHIVLANAIAGLKDFDSAITAAEKAIAVDPGRASSYAALGNLQVTKGNPARAEEAFKNAIEVDPKSVNARLALANLYWASKDYAKTEAVLKEAVGLNPQDLLTHRALAALYLGSGRAGEAEQHLKAIVEISKAPEANLALADYYITQGRRADASVLLQNLVQLRDTPVAGDASTRLAGLAFVEGRLSDAHRLVDEVLAKDTAHVGALLFKAQVHLKEGQAAKALVAAQLAVQTAPMSAQAQLILGRSLLATNNVTGAVKAFAEAARLDPRGAEAPIELARLRLAAGDLAGGTNLVQQAVANQPRNGEARLLLVSVLMLNRDLAAAERELTAIMAQLPGFAEAHVQWGVLLLHKGNRDGAHSAFEKALELDPDSMTALTNITALESGLGNFAPAKARLDARLAKRPTDAGLLLLAAKTYTTEKNLKLAEETMRRAIEADPARLESYAMLGHMLVASNRLDDARREYEQLIERDPKSVTSQTMLGMIAERQRRTDDAEQLYRRVLDIDPNAPVAANNLACLYVETGQNLDVALQLAQAAKRGAPDHPDINDTLGWVYFKKDMASLAIPPLKFSVSKNPANHLYQYHLGLALAKAGSQAEARRALQEALRLKPDFDGATEAKKVLSTLKS